MLSVRPVVKRYVLGTQATQISFRVSGRYGGWSCRSGDMSKGVPELTSFSSPCPSSWGFPCSRDRPIKGKRLTLSLTDKGKVR